MTHVPLATYRKLKQKTSVTEQSRTSSEFIFKTLCDLLVTQGYGNITLQQVASLTAISRTTLYRRWASIDALIIDAIAYQLKHSIPIPDDLEASDTLKGLLMNLGTFLQSPLGHSFLQASLAIKDEASLKQRDALWQERYSLIYEVFYKLCPDSSQQTMIDDVISMTLGSIYFQIFIKRQKIDAAFINSLLKNSLKLLDVK